MAVVLPLYPQAPLRLVQDCIAAEQTWSEVLRMPSA